MPRFFFRKNHRLVDNNHFKRVISGRTFSGRGVLRMYVLPNDTGYPRFGVSIGKKSGNAVQRNRVKRLAREAFRLEQYNIAPDYDYLLIFSAKRSKNKKTVSDIDRLDFEAIRSSFMLLSQKAVEKSLKQ